MLHRLRQVSFLVNDLDAAQGLYGRYLGMEPCHGDGQTSVVLPAGDGTFAELTRPGPADGDAARYAENRGQGPYELVFETTEYDRLHAHLRGLGVGVSEEAPDLGFRALLVNPASANGARLRIVEVAPGVPVSAAASRPWPLAGANWAAATPSRTLRLRQMAVLVRDLDSAVARWSEMFGLRATKRFQVSFTDLEIAVLPLAGRDTFIELAQPTGPDAPSQRFLDRYGEGIYLTIYEIADSLAMDAHLVEQGARFTSSRQTANYTNLGFNSIWLHPAGFMGAFTQLSQVLSPDNPWPPAGDDWHLE